ncbi:4-hydroxy-3-methylbut-2-enyl diphosphate reductase [Streptococcus parasanguinis]|nr:4-hydroxy-3-methylbut-2-enyl diphosphate reductase [Streptococcus parasanguinis]
MKLWEYVDKKVYLVLEDGTSITGKVVDWFDGYDLDGSDEIVIGDHSYPENIIKETKIISA